MKNSQKPSVIKGTEKGAFCEFLQYAKEHNFDVGDIQVSHQEVIHTEKGKLQSLLIKQ